MYLYYKAVFVHTVLEAVLVHNLTINIVPYNITIATLNHLERKNNIKIASFQCVNNFNEM